jgi:hypothetical protein
MSVRVVFYLSRRLGARFWARGYFLYPAKKASSQPAKLGVVFLENRLIDFERNGQVGVAGALANRLGAGLADLS